MLAEDSPRLAADPPADAPANTDRTEAPPRGYTAAEVARRLRVSKNKVLTWIRRGELVAVNTATVLCGKPRWVITPDALAAFEKRRAGGPPPEPPARRRRQPAVKDYFPNWPD
jgi:hypothetical protein